MTKRIALVFCLASLAQGPARADSLSFTNNITADKDVITCSDLGMSLYQDHQGDMKNVHRDQTISVRAPGSGPLHVIAPKNGGVWVQASTSGAMTATVCEVAGAASESEANALLDQVQIVNEGGELRVKGPGQDWGSFIILSVPNGASLDMVAENGSLELRGVQGTFRLETMNGPISVARVRGTVTARATNGPIAFVGHEGDMDLMAQNGPVSVKLDAPSWSGKGLDGRTQNGPIKMVVPEGLETGVRVMGTWRSPWKSKGWMIPSSGTWPTDGERSVTLGKGSVLVRLSTVNGPVDIKGPGDEKEKSSGKSRI